MQPTHIGDVKWWMGCLEKFGRERSCDAPDFLRPYHFVTLGLKLSQMRTGVRLPKSVEAYAARMRLWHAIGRMPPCEVNENASGGRFLPLARLDRRNEVEGYSDQLTEILGKDANEGTRRSLSISLHEIMENCFAHAEVANDITALACAQTWPRGDKAQIAIADMGIGIRQSLAANDLLSERLTDENSCELASEYGVTSKPGKGHAGYGLALTRQLLERNGGTFVVVSQNEWFSTHGQHSTGGLLNVPWPGTLVVLEWNTTRPLCVNEVYDSWPLPEGLNDDDFDL